MLLIKSTDTNKQFGTTFGKPARKLGSLFEIFLETKIRIEHVHMKEEKMYLKVVPVVAVVV